MTEEEYFETMRRIRQDVMERMKKMLDEEEGEALKKKNDIPEPSSGTKH